MRLIVAGAVAVAGTAAILVSFAGPDVADEAALPVAADVKDGDVLPEGTRAPPGFRVECPPALAGECVAIGDGITPEERAASAARAAGGPLSGPASAGEPMFDALTALSLAQLNVEALLRDPASARFSGVWRVTIESEGRWMPGYCGRVSGRNGFGGYATSARFVATPVLAAVDGHAGFERLYREICEDLPMVERVPHF